MPGQSKGERRRLYQGIHKDEYIPQWTLYVKFIWRFIDDGYAIWDPPAEISDEEYNIKYNEFKAVVNNNEGLTWEFTELSKSVNFLDLTLSQLCLMVKSKQNFLRSQWHSTYTSHHIRCTLQEP